MKGSDTVLRILCLAVLPIIVIFLWICLGSNGPLYEKRSTIGSAGSASGDIGLSNTDSSHPPIASELRKKPRVQNGDKLHNEFQIIELFGDGSDLDVRIADIEKRCNPELFESALGMYVAKVKATQKEMLPLDSYRQIHNEKIRKNFIGWISDDAAAKDFTAFANWVPTLDDYRYIAAEEGLFGLKRKSERTTVSLDELEAGLEVIAKSLQGKNGKMKSMWATDAARFLEDMSSDPERVDAWVRRIGMEIERDY